MKSKKPLGKLSPWVWSVEFVRGCNLRCWHCTAKLRDISYMSLDTWEAMCKVMHNVTPHKRLELAQAGEPTLHPNLLECLSMAKKITPTTQIQVTTNGLTLLSGEVNFKELFKCGANSVYVDMYGPLDKFINLANKSGIEWYKYDKVKKLSSNVNHRMANTFYNDPNMKLIILQDHPEERLRWRNNARLSTFLNHVDFNECLQYGLVPVREPYKRKCTLPMRYSSVDVDGNYLFCCIDFWCESAGLLGNVKQGSEGFIEYWFGLLMQVIRQHLRTGSRDKIPYCSRCNCTFSKCDWVRMWPDNAYEVYFENNIWKHLPIIDKNDSIFKSGWRWCQEVNEQLPSIETEEKILLMSKKRIIHSSKILKG